MVYNEKPTQEWLPREDSSSPTAALESIILTGVIDAHEKHDVMMWAIPHAFIHSAYYAGNQDWRWISNDKDYMSTGWQVSRIEPWTIQTLCGLQENKAGTICTRSTDERAIYAMLEAALPWYTKFRSELEAEGFKFNSYDPSGVANCQRKGSQHMLLFHVIDLKSSHKKTHQSQQPI